LVRSFVPQPAQFRSPTRAVSFPNPRSFVPAAPYENRALSRFHKESPTCAAQPRRLLGVGLALLKNQKPKTKYSFFATATFETFFF
jgi:hypothetical protein